MDLAPPRTSTSSSASSFHFSKLCKRRSVTMSSSNENPSPKCHSSGAEAVNGPDDNRDRRVHPQPLEEPLIPSSRCSEEAVILKLFDAITALKCSYVQLQQAHIPYQPKKIKIADELMVSVLETLTNLEEAYRSRSSLSLAIQEYQVLLAQLQSKMHVKDSEIRRLKWEIEELETKNAALEKTARQKIPPERGLFSLNWELTPALFSDVFRFTAKSFHDFAKPLISLMKASGWDLDRAVSSLHNSVIFAERSHKKYAFEAYLSGLMLDAEPPQDVSFPLDQFDRVMTSQDPFDALMEDPDSWFGRFCRSKYAQSVPSKMESSFFGNLDQRSFVLGGGHPRTPFYRAFARMARWAWALQAMANSFIPKAEIFYAEKGCEFSKDFMESVVDGAVSEGGEKEKLKVGFSVTPGFRIGSTIVRSRVYLCRMECSIDNSDLRL